MTPAETPRLPGASIPISRQDVEAAAARIAPYATRTPVLTSRALNALCGASLFFKCENLQRGGAFKFRGAINTILQLPDDQRARGVITHSSGNHGQALALAGSIVGVPAVVVMPRTAAEVKRAATESYGARVVLCEPTLAAREDAVAAQIDEYAYTLVHPYDDWRVIAGQGTAALELLEQAGPLDAILTPCGGGGLLSGTALLARETTPRPRVIGVEPAQADDARRSLEAGHILPSNDPRTIADGLRTSLGTRTFAVIRACVEQIATAREDEIVAAMRMLWERMKLVVEPSAAVPLAPLLNRALGLEGARVGIILSGGNVDLSAFFDQLAARWLGS